MHTDTSASIHAAGAYQTMGKKTFWYQFYKRASVPFGILAVALVLAIARAQNLVPADMAGYVRIGEQLGLVVAFVVGVTAFAVAKIVHRSNAFALTDDALKIRRGVWKREEFAIPYRQIQNIEIERTLTQRVLGLSRVIILTAAQEHESTRHDAPESILPAVDADIASGLQDELLRRSNTQRVTEVPSPAPHAA